MKSLITIIISFCITLPVIAQGTVLWKNTSMPRVPIYDFDETTLLSGAMYLVDLFYGPVGAHPSTFTSLGLATPFGTGAAAGYFNAGVVVIPGFASGSQVQIQARAWRASDGATWYIVTQKYGGHASSICYGDNPAITITLGGGASPPSAPASFEGSLLAHSLRISVLVVPPCVPEPSTFLLGIGGLTCLVFLRRRKA